MGVENPIPLYFSSKILIMIVFSMKGVLLNMFSVVRPSISGPLTGEHSFLSIFWPAHVSSRMEALAGLCLAYRKDHEETRAFTSVSPQMLRSAHLSFHLSESSHACLMHHFQIFFFKWDST